MIERQIKHCHQGFLNRFKEDEKHKNYFKKLIINVNVYALMLVLCVNPGYLEVEEFKFGQLVQLPTLTFLPHMIKSTLLK